ncbi:zinc finger, C2H2 type [Trichuris suis]|nr:zinc finger, C2H2 type [Trichuris suis]
MIDESVLEIFSNAPSNVGVSSEKFVSVEVCTTAPISGDSSVEHVSLAPTFDYVAARLNSQHFSTSIAVELSNFLCTRVPAARIVSCESFLCVTASLKDLIMVERYLNTFVPKASENKHVSTTDKELARKYAYFCPKCPYRCSRKEALCKHRHLHSLGRRLHVCRICSFSSFSKSTLEQHSSRHSGYSVSCSLCGMSFYRRKLLANHVRLRHGCNSSQTRVYRCSACAYETKSSKRFQRHCCGHRQRSIVRKTYKCKLCSYAAPSKGRVNRHINEVHLRHQYDSSLSLVGISVRLFAEEEYAKYVEEHSLERKTYCYIAKDFTQRPLRIKADIPAVFADNLLVSSLLTFLGGKKCCLHVHGVFPYFYVQSPCAYPSEEFLNAIKADLNRQLEAADLEKFASTSKVSTIRRYVRQVSAVKLTPFYGYHQSASTFLKIVLYNPLLISKASQFCYLGKVKGVPMQPYEAHIPFALQFFIDYNLYGMDFIRLSAVKMRCSSDGGTERSDESRLKPQSRCQIEMDCTEAEILNVTLPSSGQLKNPGLKYIWEDEAERRKCAEILTPFSYKAESQGERKGFSRSESEKTYSELLDAKLAGLSEGAIVQSTPKANRRESETDSQEFILNNSDLAVELLTEYLLGFPKEEAPVSSLPEIVEMFDSQKRAKTIESEFQDVFGDIARQEEQDIDAEVVTQINEQLEMSQRLSSLVTQPITSSETLSPNSVLIPQVDGPPGIQKDDSCHWYRLNDNCLLPDVVLTDDNSETEEIEEGSEEGECSSRGSDSVNMPATFDASIDCWEQSYLEEFPLEAAGSSGGEPVLRNVNPSPVQREDLETLYPKLEKSGTTDRSLGTSFGFDVTAVDFSEARAVHDILHITIMSVEVHVETRRQLKADPEFDPVTALFASVHSMGLKDAFQTYCFWWCTSTDPKVSGRLYENVHFTFAHPYIEVRVSSEKDLFEKFEKVVIKNDPDILVGYELEMLSWGYLLDRADHLGYDLRSRCSRIQEQRRYKRPAVVNSWSLVDVLNVTGRVALNLWFLMKHVVTLRCYTFENVAFHVLHMRVPFYTQWQLTEWFKARKSRWRVFHYYFLRTIANLQLLISRDIVNRTSEMARLFGIQFLEVLNRGSQFRVESIMLRMAKAEGYVAVSPTPDQRRRMSAPECIALNMEPESMFCSYPVLVLDFQSLYPSICIAYNYCFSTCLGKVSELCSHERIDFGCWKLKVPASTLSELRQHLVCSPAGVVFVDNTIRRGILPEMLEEILNTRIMVKKCMKEYANDKALVKVLDARQMGLKLIANVTYGYTSANYSGRMPCVEIADSIVQKGRETLEAAIRMVNSNERWNAKVIYGDTDRQRIFLALKLRNMHYFMFVALPGRDKEEAFKIGAEIAAAVTEVNPYPVKLKFEKVYLPCVLQTKKRYVGYAYESADQKKPIFDAKGIETVRRDTCPLVSKTLEKMLKVLFDSGDIKKAERYVMEKFEHVLSGSEPFEDFIFAKEYRGRDWYKANSAVPALSIARRRLAGDRRNEPRIGERVPYVIVCGEPRSTLISCVREPWELIRNPNLRLNYVYYVVRQLVPALNRVCNLFNLDCHNLFVQISGRSGAFANRKVKRFRAGNGICQSTLSQFVQIHKCPICSDPTVADMCSDCMNDPMNSYLTLQYRLQDAERKMSSAVRLCQICSQYIHSPGFPEDGCVSIDCPVYFQRLLICDNFVASAKQFQQLTDVMFSNQ